jgi:hypothetical protein
MDNKPKCPVTGKTEVRNRKRSSGDCRTSDHNCERAGTTSDLSVHVVPLLASHEECRESREGSQMTDLPRSIRLVYRQFGQPENAVDGTPQHDPLLYVGSRRRRCRWRCSPAG